MKKSKKILWFSFFILTVSFLSGCIMTGNEEGDSPFPKPNKVEDYAGPEKSSPIIANKILDHTLKGLKEGDYNEFSYRFNVDLKKRITKKEFTQLREGLSDQIGEFMNREYLGCIQKGPLMIYLWKAEFSKAENNDLIIRLTLGELDEAVQVFAFEISNR